MKFNFDSNKDAINLAKHQLSLADAAKLDWMAALIWVDSRRDYGEIRQIGFCLLLRARLTQHIYRLYQKRYLDMFVGLNVAVPLTFSLFIRDKPTLPITG